MRRTRREEGAVLVEFALVLPLLLLLVLGTISFGFALNYWIDETHLAREAARYAAVDRNPGPETTLQSSIQRQADTKELRDGGTDQVTDAATVCLSFPTNPVTGTVGEVGDPVEARMSVDYNFIPFIGEKLGVPTITIDSSATMRLEAVPTEFSAGC